MGNHYTADTLFWFVYKLNETNQILKCGVIWSNSIPLKSFIRGYSGAKCAARVPMLLCCFADSAHVFFLGSPPPRVLVELAFLLPWV